MKKIFLFVILFVSNIYSSNLSISLEPHFYADNTEFFNDYRTGETYLGNDIKTYIKYISSENLFLKFGIYLNFYYGDENIISQILPISTLKYHIKNNFSFIFGSLENEKRHNMLDAIQIEQLTYYRRIEYGFQLKLNYKYLKSDSWINWNLLNTPEHREYFDFGNNFNFIFWNFILNLQTYISHHGGQLYHTGAVKDNLCLAIGLINSYKGNSIFNGFGYSFYYLTDKNIQDRGIPDLTTTGYGFLGEIYLMFFNFKIYFDYWKGNNFITEEGDPIYKTNNDYFFYGFKKEKYIKNNTLFLIELRMHYIDSSFEYQYRFEFKSKFNFNH